MHDVLEQTAFVIKIFKFDIGTLDLFLIYLKIGDKKQFVIFFILFGFLGYFPYACGVLDFTYAIRKYF